jgi:hypothetical protein
VGDFSLAGRRRPGKRASAYGESSLAGPNRLHEDMRLLDRARRAAIFCPIAVSRSGKKENGLCMLRVSVVKSLSRATTMACFLQ